MTGGAMRLACYNVENLFERAAAMNQSNWSVGRPALNEHAELNRLFKLKTYGAADKRRMLALLNKHNLINNPRGKFLTLRVNRGPLVRKPRNGAVTIVPDGRDDWLGWVELTREPVAATAVDNTARIIDLLQADIVAVVEAENRPGLLHFNERIIAHVGGTPFDQIMLIDGNDERGIDVGLMACKSYPIALMRSHVDDRDRKGRRIFSRDCAEYAVRLPDKRLLWLLINHFKSKGYGKPAQSDARRRAQAERVREICDGLRQQGETLIAVLGDLNDTPDGKSKALVPLLKNGSGLRDVSEIAGFQDGGRPGTYGNGTAGNKIDFILMSEDLFVLARAGGIERRGVWGGKHGTLFPHLDTMHKPADAASDHAALWVDLAL